MSLPRSTPLHRSLCATGALIALCLFMLAWSGHHFFMREQFVRGAIEVESLLLAALALTLWATRARWTENARALLLRAYANGALVATLIGLCALSSPDPDFEQHGLPVMIPLAGSVGYLIGSAILLAAAAWIMGAKRALLWAAPFMILAWWLPWMAICAVLGLVAFRAGNRWGFGAVILVMAGLLSHFYYSLHMNLLLKSGALAAGGVAVLALLAALRSKVFAPSKRLEGLRQNWRWQGIGRKWAAGLAVAVCAALGPGWFAIAKHELTLANEQIVLLELAPVDPRSLMQGDYMALNFAANGKWLEHCESDCGTITHVYLELDAQNRATVAGVGRNAEAPPGRIALRLRAHGRGLSVGPNAFFFQEGTGKAYAAARYGEFRVSSDGAALLTHLRDEKLQRIEP